MKVEEPPPVAPAIAKAGERGPRFEDSPGSARDKDGDENHALSEPTLDIAALHGVDETHIEPDMRRVFVDLMEEVSLLREALDRNQKRVDFLTDLADRDPVSSLLNRRAFMRELTHGLTLLTNDQGQGCLVFLHVKNLGEIHKAQGIDVGDAVIEHVAALLLNHMMMGDVLGRVEGATFGLILIGRDAEAAREEAIAMATMLESHPLVWRSMENPLTITWTMHVLAPGEDAAEALAVVDANLQGRSV